MRGLFGFSIVEFVQKRKRARWISQGLEPKKIQLNNGTDLHCWVLQSKNPHTEKERPALLLIHGFGADGQTGWDDQICSLGKHFDLFIPDLIFFGESTTMSSERTEIFQAECLKSMLDCLGVESVIVVGHSYGGFVAFWMAHKYPNLVRRLVIVSSAICMMPSTNDPLLKAFGSSNIKDFLLPNDAGDLKRAMNLTFYKMPLPWIPGFLYKDMFQTMGGNKEQRAELLDALVIGTKKSRPLPTVNQVANLEWNLPGRSINLGREGSDLPVGRGLFAPKAYWREGKGCGHKRVWACSFLREINRIERGPAQISVSGYGSKLKELKW